MEEIYFFYIVFISLLFKLLQSSERLKALSNKPTDLLLTCIFFIHFNSNQSHANIVKLTMHLVSFRLLYL